MAHSVGDRCVQVLTVDAVVEGVPTYACRRLEPAGEGEGTAFDGVGSGQQATLDLGCERERHVALGPLEQIRVPARDDQRVREGVGSRPQVPERVRIRALRDRELEDSHRVAALGDRNKDPPAAAVRLDMVLLAPQDSMVHGVIERQRLRAFVCPVRHATLPGDDVRDPDRRRTREVGKKEADFSRIKHPCELSCENFDGFHRRGRLDGREQAPEVESDVVCVDHRHTVCGVVPKLIAGRVRRRATSCAARTTSPKSLATMQRIATYADARGLSKERWAPWRAAGSLSWGQGAWTAECRRRRRFPSSSSGSAYAGTPRRRSTARQRPPKPEAASNWSTQARLVELPKRRSSSSFSPASPSSSWLAIRVMTRSTPRLSGRSSPSLRRLTW